MVCVSGILSSLIFLFLIIWSESSEEVLKDISPTLNVCFFAVLIFLLVVSLDFFSFDVDMDVSTLGNV